MELLAPDAVFETHRSDARSTPANGVLLVVPWDQEFGGVNSVVRNLARYLVETGREPIFLFPGDTVRPREGVSRLGFPALYMNLRPVMVRQRPVKSLGGFLLNAPIALHHLMRIVRERNIGVVNVHYPGDNTLYFAALHHLTGIRLVTSVHGSDLTGLPARCFRRFTTSVLMRDSDVVVAPSQWFADYARHEFPASASKMIAIRNGIDSQVIRAVETKNGTEFVSHPLDGVGDIPYVVCVAAFNRKKAHDTLIRAFASVAGPSQLVLIGDGPLRADIERLIDELGLGGRIVLVGNQPPNIVARVLAGAVCSVLPSRNEPFGIAAAESMALGTPVVTSGVGGLGEIVTHELTGLTFPVDDAPALAAALNRLLGDHRLRERLAEAGSSYARTNFDWRRSASRYVEVAYSRSETRA